MKNILWFVFGFFAWVNSLSQTKELDFFYPDPVEKFDPFISRNFKQFFTPDENYLIQSSSYGTVVIDLKTLEIVQNIPYTFHKLFFDNEKKLAVGTTGGDLETVRKRIVLNIESLPFLVLDEATLEPENKNGIFLVNNGIIFSKNPNSVRYIQTYAIESKTKGYSTNYEFCKGKMPELEKILIEGKHNTINKLVVDNHKPFNFAFIITLYKNVIINQVLNELEVVDENCVYVAVIGNLEDGIRDTIHLRNVRFKYETEGAMTANHRFNGGTSTVDLNENTSICNLQLSTNHLLFSVTPRWDLGFYKRAYTIYDLNKKLIFNYVSDEEPPSIHQTLDLLTNEEKLKAFLIKLNSKKENYTDIILTDKDKFVFVGNKGFYSFDPISAKTESIFSFKDLFQGDSSSFLDKKPIQLFTNKNADEFYGISSHFITVLNKSDGVLFRKRLNYTIINELNFCDNKPGNIKLGYENNISSKVFSLTNMNKNEENICEVVTRESAIDSWEKRKDKFEIFVQDSPVNSDGVFMGHVSHNPNSKIVRELGVGSLKSSNNKANSYVIVDLKRKKVINQISVKRTEYWTKSRFDKNGGSIGESCLFYSNNFHEIFIRDFDKNDLFKSTILKYDAKSKKFKKVFQFSFPNVKASYQSVSGTLYYDNTYYFDPGHWLFVREFFDNKADYFLTDSLGNVISQGTYFTQKLRIKNTLEGYVQRHSYDKNKRVLALQTSLSSLKFFDLKSNTEIGTFYDGESNNFVFVTREGYYSGTREAVKSLKIRKGNELIGYENFDVLLNRPDLVLNKVECKDSSLLELTKAAVNKRNKIVEGKNESNDDKLTQILNGQSNLPNIKLNTFKKTTKITGEVSLQYTITSKTTQKGKLMAFNNGVKIVESDIVVKAPYLVTNEIIFIPDNGENKVIVQYESSDGFMGQKQQRIYLNKNNAKPNLFLISIGSEKFKNKNLNLTYAVKDAKDIQTLFEKNPLFSKVNSLQIINEKFGIGTLKEINLFLSKAKYTDQIILYYAGHGMLNTDLEYYLPTNNFSLNNIEKTAVKFQDLVDVLKKQKPYKKLVFLDACFSGEVDKTETYELATIDQKDVQFRAAWNTMLKGNNGIELAKSYFNDFRENDGINIVSSASGLETAQESKSWNNGLFTYCLKNALEKKEADLDGDNEIYLDELLNYLSDKVYTLSNGKQRPTFRNENNDIRIKIW